jgi:cyclophilin family peptidyl-prolyl cis-trans isomerase
MRNAAAAIALLLLAGCASSTPRVEPSQRVTIATTGGSFSVRLLPNLAPKTVAQFLRLVRGGVYDSVYFYRVEQHFVAQAATADDREVPLTTEQRALIAPIPLETGELRHARGVLSLAHGDDPNSGETSFSILLADAPHLDGKFTIFGVLEGGDDVLHAIESSYNQQARDKDGKRLQIISIKAE